MTWEWGGPLYDPDLQKGRKKPRLSDIKVKFPPKPARCNEMNERIKELAVQAGDDWDHTMPEDKDCPRCGHCCPQRPWVGLTDEELDAITSNVIGFNSCVGWEEDYAKAIESKLKEKNT